MASLQELKKYIDYPFTYGPVTGDDYRSFQTKYVNYLKRLCKENGWELLRVNRNHYCFSVFIRNLPAGMFTWTSATCATGRTNGTS